MKNGLYSVHIQMGDGVKGRASGVIVFVRQNFTAAIPISGRSAPTQSGTATGRATSSPTSNPLSPTHGSAGFGPAGKSPPAFPVPFGMTLPRCSAPRWSAPEASVSCDLAPAGRLARSALRCRARFEARFVRHDEERGYFSMCHDPSQSWGGGFTLKPSMRLIRAIDGPSPGIASSDALNARKRIIPSPFAVGCEPFKVLVPRCQLLRREFAFRPRISKTDSESGLARHHDPVDLSNLDRGARRRKGSLRNQIAGAIHLVRALQPRGEVYDVAHHRIAHHDVGADAADQRFAGRNTDPQIACLHGRARTPSNSGIS